MPPRGSKIKKTQVVRLGGRCLHLLSHLILASSPPSYPSAVALCHEDLQFWTDFHASQLFSDDTVLGWANSALDLVLSGSMPVLLVHSTRVSFPALLWLGHPMLPLQETGSVLCSHVSGTGSSLPTPSEPAPLCCQVKTQCSLFPSEGQRQLTLSHDLGVTLS